MSLADSAKYIQRLVRVISEKEKIIDQLKKEGRQAVKEEPQKSDLVSSMTEERLSSQLSEMNGQVRCLVSKMNEMQLQIKELESGLQEQIILNQRLQQQLNKKVEKQITLDHELKQLKKKCDEYSQKQSQMAQKQQFFVNQIGLLQSKIVQLTAEAELSANLKKELETLQNTLSIQRDQSKSLRQFIDGLYLMVKAKLIDQFEQPAQKYSKQGASLQQKIASIENYIQQSHHEDNDIFNQTIDGYSLIMKSFQEKLEEVQCLSQRSTAHADQQQNLKASAKSVPPVLQRFSLKNSEKQALDYPRRQKLVFLS